MALELSVFAQSEGGYVNTQFTCDGSDFSPRVTWSGVPRNTKSLALIMEDPDAPMGTFVHWVVFNIAPVEEQLNENFPKIQRINENITQGYNDFRRIGYGGPCPPKGQAHRYFFRLYATWQEPDLQPGLKKKELKKQIESKIIEDAEAVFKYARR